MLLSIVMMIKNEEKYLDKTLYALKTLMNKVESELIILDTGSTDNSIEICKKYTDKIFFAKWNNNFADMRNLSISYASGDWILILDADEELIEFEKLIEFFYSGIYKKYNCASIELKNIVSENLDEYIKSRVLRLFRNKNFKYEGAIHEQPCYKKPIYNNIATFNHYGYMYMDDEDKKRKVKRNEKILIEEINKNPNNPYINFQLAKNFMVEENYEEALYYMEKSMKLHNELNMNIQYVYINLANLYFKTEKFEKCEETCLSYLKIDDKSIDVYYYLAISQSMLNKTKESLENYNKYIYLIDNYEISTEANSIFCDGTTISLIEEAQIDMVKKYYLLEEYDRVIESIKSMKADQIKNIYAIVFMSLLKLDMFDSVLTIYDNLTSNIDKKIFKVKLESMILNIRQSQRDKIYKVLTKIDGNYGVLNKVRLGKKLSLEEYNRILREEKESYYSELIYYALQQEFELENILNGIDKVYIKEYFDYLFSIKKDFTIDMYKYLLNTPNTLDLNKISMYSDLSKSLLLYGNYRDDKYLNLFLMYIMYTYQYLKSIYNNLSDEDLLRYISNKDERFVINIVNIQRIKKYNKLDYIRKMKSILIESPSYKKGIEILIKNFEKEIKESEELKKLKIEYKSIIENNINNGNIDEAISMIKESEALFEQDIEIYNMKGIINIFNNNLTEAEYLFKIALLLDNNNLNTLFNIAYIKELLENNKEAVMFYSKILDISEDENLILEAREKIKYIKQS